MKNARDQQTVADIGRSFGAAAAINDTQSIDTKDMILFKKNDQVPIAFVHDKKVALLCPVSLLIHYSGSTKGE